MRKTADLTLLKNLVYFYSILGTFPHTFKKQFVFKSVFTLLSFLLSLGITICYVMDIKKYSFTPSAAILYTGATFTLVVFNLLCYINMSYYLAIWNDLFRNLDEFNFTMEEIQIEENTIFYHFKIIFLNLVTFLLYAVVIFSIGKDISFAPIIFYCYAYFTDMQILATTFVFWNILRILGKRYDFLKEKLKEIYQSSKCFDIFWNREKLKGLVLLLNDVLVTINHIFGKRILVIFILTFFSVLNIFQYMFLDFPVKEERSILRKWSVFLKLFCHLVSDAQIFNK